MLFKNLQFYSRKRLTGGGAVACDRVHWLELKVGFKALTRPFGIGHEFDVEIRSCGKHLHFRQFIAQDANGRREGISSVVDLD